MTVAVQKPDPQDRQRMGAAQWIELLALVAVPIGIAGALIGYIGWVRARSFYGYFGIKPEVVGLSDRGFAFTGSEATFGAAARLLGALLVVLALDQAVRFAARFLPARARRWTEIVVLLLGAACLLVGLTAAVSAGFGLDVDPLLWAGLLGLGSILVVRWGARLVPSGDRWARWTAGGLAATAFVIAAFWAGTVFAVRLGTDAARAIDADVSALPVATVFSNEPLDVPGSDVVATDVPLGGGGTGYRYDGLSLLDYGNERWFLITGRRAEDLRSSVLVLRDTESIRVQTAAPLAETEPLSQETT